MAGSVAVVSSAMAGMIAEREASSRQMTALPAGQAVVQLLHGLRRRRWWQAALVWGGWGWQVSAWLLLVAGLVPAGWRPLPWSPWVGLIALPPLILFAAGLCWRRPTLADCAWWVDRWCEGHALCTSAWELLNTSSPAPASAPLILRRAEQAVPAWRDQLVIHCPWTLPTPVLLALLPALVGSFLLLSVVPPPTSGQLALPAAVVRPLAVAAGTVAPSPAWSAIQSLSATRSPAPVPTATMVASAPTGGPVAAVTQAADPASPQPPLSSLIPAPPGGLPDSAPSLPLAGGTPGPGRATGTGGDQPGDGSDHQTAAAPVAVPLAVQYVELTRHGTAAPSANGVAGELLATAAVPPLTSSVPAAVPPAERVALPWNSTAGLAWRRYLTAYFNRPTDEPAADR